MGTILVVTQQASRFDELSAAPASHGFYTFVAIPDAVASLWAVTQFDLVVITSDVTSTDRGRLAQITPPLAPRILTLEADEETLIVDRIRARLVS